MQLVTLSWAMHCQSQALPVSAGIAHFTVPKLMYTAEAEAAVNLQAEQHAGYWVSHVRLAHALNRGNDHAARPLSHMIMVALVAAATSGATPISSISGPLTMPPPTPNMPVKADSKQRSYDS